MTEEKFKTLRRFELIRCGEYIGRIRKIAGDEVYMMSGEIYNRSELSENLFEIGDTIVLRKSGRKVKVCKIAKHVIDSTATFTYEKNNGESALYHYISPEDEVLTFFAPMKPREEELQGSCERMDIVNNMCSILDDASYEYNKGVIVDIVNEFFANKAELLSILRKHPNWDEKNLCIKGEVEETRVKDGNDFLKACKEFYHNCRENGMYLTDKQLDIMWDGVQCTPPQQFVTEMIKERYEAVGVHMTVGAKYSRELNKIFVDMGLDKYPNYNHDFAVIADTVNPLKNTQVAILSVNPCDFLKMSYGEGWDSCHHVGHHGCYHAGTQSYIMDSSSMIFYTLSNQYVGEPWENNKLTRQIYCYQNGLLLQSRNYPNYKLPQRDATYTYFVSQTIADCIGIKNEYRKVDHSHICTAENSLHYPDYNYEQYNTNLYAFDSIWDGEDITIGHISWCLQCGDELCNAGNMICDDCDNEEDWSTQEAFFIDDITNDYFYVSEVDNYAGYDEEHDVLYAPHRVHKCNCCHRAFYGNNSLVDGLCKDCREKKLIAGKKVFVSKKGLIFIRFLGAKEMFPTLQLFDRKACGCYYDLNIFGTIIKTFKWMYDGAEHTLCALNVDDKYVCIVDIDGIKEVD